MFERNENNTSKALCNQSRLPSDSYIVLDAKVGTYVTTKNKTESAMYS